jgi:hypothetical protein
MEDSDDKVRRNVIAFSCAIIAGTVLGISVTKGSLFGVEIKTAYPNRVWLLFWLSSVYFIQRYHFAEETLKQRRSARIALLNRVATAFVKILRRDLNRTTVDKKTSKYLLPIEEDTIHHKAKERPKSSPIDGEFYVKGFPMADDDKRSLRELFRDARTSSSLIVNNPAFRTNLDGDFEHIESQHGMTQLRFKLPTMLISWTAVRCVAQALIVSKQSVDLFVPYILGATALSICTYRLAVAACMHWAPWIKFHSPF